MPCHHRRSLPLIAACLALSTLLAGCSVKKMAVNALADTLSGTTGGSLSQDEDMEFVGEAVPFALKLMEILHGQAPEHVGLHLAMASGFTQYGVVYIQFPAEQTKYDDFAAYQHGMQRARMMFLRARDYALGGMELVHPGVGEQLYADTDAALAPLTEADVPFLYWLGASWLAAISTSKEHPELIGELPIAAALLHRALELDEDWDRGAIHEVLISLEPSLPMPGGEDRSREHFERALELSDGVKAGPYVSLATAICIDNQDREQFESLLDKALAVDLDASPDDTLANVYAQRRARFLLDHIDDLFLAELEEIPDEGGSSPVPPNEVP